MCISLLCAGQSAFSLRLMFSFDVKREPENHQRFRRAGSTRKGLLAPFRPRRGSRNGKKLAASLRRVAAPSVCFATARILLAAAPTAPPCFRHWRRSSLLHIFLCFSYLRLRRRFQALAELYRQQRGNTRCEAANRRNEKKALSAATSFFPFRQPLRGLKGASSPFLVPPAPRK